MTSKTYCGYVALIGRPNVGKSTILNNSLKQKVSITSSKPQTTQRQILGIKTTDDYQIIFVDTPGLHQGLVKHQKNTLTKHMGRSVTQAINDVDIIVFVVAGTEWNNDDEYILQQIQMSNLPCVLVVNKIDRIKQKDQLLPYVKSITDKYDFKDVFYVSALKDAHLDNLVESLTEYLPTVASADDFYFERDRVTDQNTIRQSCEIIREKLIRLTNKEIPYDIAIDIEECKYSNTKKGEKILILGAVIWVQRSGQKAIVIGKSGETLKKIGSSARIDLEQLFNSKVHLNLWVKIKSNWSSDDKMLTDLGFNTDD